MSGEAARYVGPTVEEANKGAIVEYLDTFYSEVENRTDTMNNIISIFAVIQPDNTLYAAKEKRI